MHQPSCSLTFSISPFYELGREFLELIVYENGPV